MSILEKISKQDLKTYLENCAHYVDFDVDRAFSITLDYIKQHDGKSFGDIGEMIDLQTKWDKSLRDGNPDYSIYESPFYFCDIWLCWIKYSRSYLKMVQSEKSMFGRSIASDMHDIKTVLDLGCGFGYTSAALKEIFPMANVVGTNLEHTSQYKMAKELGRQFGFSIASTHDIGKVDLVFASEYFEHINKPLEHLIDVLHDCRPKYLLIANSFNTVNMGHFSEYDYRGKKFPASRLSRMFNETLKFFDYRKVKTKCWNNKPAYWKKS